MMRFSNSSFYWLLILTFMWHFNRSLQENVESYSDDCRPQLADRCFNNLAQAFRCSYQTNNCDGSKEICELLDDSLTCASDIIDGDCSKTYGGVVNFHSWLRGLRAVHSYMCNPEIYNGTHGAELPDLADSFFKSWDKRKFVRCVGQMLNIRDVVDIFNTLYNYTECVHMVVSMTNCYVLTVPKKNGSHDKKFINGLLNQFFSQHKCDALTQDKNGTGFLTPPKYLLMPIATIIMVLNIISNNIL